MPAGYHAANRKEVEHYEKQNACKVQNTPPLMVEKFYSSVKLPINTLENFS